jgi:hypothetical protein
MTLRPELIQELRDRFKLGATPSRLIRLIVERHPGGGVTHWTVRDYLKAAFALPAVPYLRPGEDYRSDAGLGHAILNKLLLPEILERRRLWDGCPEGEPPAESSWLDGLHPVSPEEAKEAEKEGRVYGLSAASWDRLSPSEKESLRVLAASSRVLSDRLDALATLAECLQRQVDEVEGRQAAAQDDR